MTPKTRFTVVIPYYKTDNEVLVFLQKRTLDAPTHPDYFGFFGGYVEEGEVVEEAMRREVKEELDIDVSNYEYFGHYEYYTGIEDIYTMLVDKDFSDKVTILEGQYGKFLKEADIIKEEKISHKNRLILNDFFSVMKKEK